MSTKSGCATASRAPLDFEDVNYKSRQLRMGQGPFIATPASNAAGESGLTGPALAHVLDEVAARTMFRDNRAPPSGTRAAGGLKRQEGGLDRYPQTHMVRPTQYARSNAHVRRQRSRFWRGEGHRAHCAVMTGPSIASCNSLTGQRQRRARRRFTKASSASGTCGEHCQSNVRRKRA